MIPKKYAPVLFGFVLSVFMTSIVSFISTSRAAGLGEGFIPIWLGAWGVSFVIAFPVVLVVGPMIRKIVDRLSAD